MSLAAISYPVRIKQSNYVIRLLDNDTLVWAGQEAFMVDREGKVFRAPDLSFNDPWWHCATCLAAGESDFVARASISAKFCPKCGTALDWEHTEKDPASEQEANAALQAEIGALVAEAKAEGVSPDNGESS